LARFAALLLWRRGTDTVGKRKQMRRLIGPKANPGDAAGHAWPRSTARPLRWLIFLGLIVVSTAWVLGRQKPRLDRRPGSVVPQFELVDSRTGQVDRLSDYRGRVLVVVFVGTSCPVGDLYMPRLVELSKKFEPRNVDFVAINSNASDTGDDVADYARRSLMIFPMLKDVDNRVADVLLAERTCEALVIDGRGRLRYRGAIDDQYGLGSRRDSAVHHYLTDAIDAVLAGRDVAVDMTQVVGCPIERKAPPRSVRSLSRRASPIGQAASVADPASQSRLTGSDKVPSYAEDVAPILHARCASCHRPGQVAPFSLLTYEQAHRWAASIMEVVGDRRMPPWHADPRYGHFANDRSLTPREQAVLIAWAKEGAPRGSATADPEPPRYPQGWSIGTPDLVYEMPETFRVQAEGTVPIKHFRLATTHTEDLYIQAAEARPGDRAVVHHICIYIDDHKKKKNDVTRNKNLLVAYTPGDMPSVYAPGIAKKIPPGVDLVFEVHYTPIGQVRFDRTSVGVIFSKERPRQVAITRGIAGWGLTIPPGAPDHVHRAAWAVPKDSFLLSMTPHMHLRGKSFTYVAHFPDGRDEILLSVPAYDFNWQSVYRLTEPKALPKGSTVHCEAHFDNSADNPANPNPGQTVHWGEQTDDEMMIGFLDYFEEMPTSPGLTVRDADH
jgi:thiol-disulfide isomerase/thioredoxin